MWLGEQKSNVRYGLGEFEYRVRDVILSYSKRQVKVRVVRRMKVCVDVKFDEVK